MKLEPVGPDDVVSPNMQSYYRGYSEGLKAAADEFRRDLDKAEREAYEQGLVEGRDRLECWKDRVNAARYLVERFRRVSTASTSFPHEAQAYKRAAELLEAALEGAGDA